MQALSQLSYTPVPRKSAHYSDATYACKADFPKKLPKEISQGNYRYFFRRASMVSRGNSANTASTDGVCVCPTSITRNGIASLGIFKLCLTSNSLISAPNAGASHATSAKHNLKMPR